MPKAKIAKTTIDALEPKRCADGSLADGYLWDAELKGFGCKATPGGKKVFIVQYRVGGRVGKTQRVTLGPHGKITADQARKMARSALGKIADGQDPARTKREERRKLAGETFKDIVESFFAVHAKDTRYWHEKRARLASGDLENLCGRPIHTITRAQISGAIEAVQTRSHAAARLLFADIRPIFAWVLNRGTVETQSHGRHARPLAAR